MIDPFDETLQLSADSFFLLPNTELITYFPAGGESRQIRAVVHRPGPEPIDGFAGVSRESVELLVKNHATEGILSSQLNTGGDKVEAGMRDSRRPVKLRIVEILGQDAGMLRLKAQ